MVETEDETTLLFLHMLIRKKEMRGSGDGNGVFVLISFGLLGHADRFMLFVWSILFVSLFGTLMWNNGGFYFIPKCIVCTLVL